MLRALEVWLWFTCLELAASLALLKGRGALFGAGFLLTPACWFVGALRIARPNSEWARRFYDESKVALAEDRYDDDVTPYRRWYTIVAVTLPVLPLAAAAVSLAV